MNPRWIAHAAARTHVAVGGAGLSRGASNPDHPSLRFKKVHATLPIYSVRIDLDRRAVGVLREGLVVWFWVGPHRECDKLLTKI